MSTDAAQWWPAPLAAGAVDATVDVPGSKSLTNRALVLGALSDGESTITSALRSRDTELMVAALRTLGIGIDVTSQTESSMSLAITPHYLGTEEPIAIDVGLAGTVMRFLPPVAALATGEITFDGDKAARRRPMATLIEAMRDVGIEVNDAGRGQLPFLINGRGHVPGGEVVLDASRSSQFVSALLLSGARFEAGVTVHHVGPPVPSTPHIDMTIAMLAEQGATVRAVIDEPIGGQARRTWHLDPRTLEPIDRVIEPDTSNALPFIAAAMITGGSVRIRRWPRASMQPTQQLLEVLTALGAHLSFDDDGLVVHGPEVLSPIDVDLSDIGETAPSFVALAAFADGPSQLRGIGHLRGHETDRLTALQTEFANLGGSVEPMDDGLRIEPTELRGGRFHTYDDHRMATTAAIVGLRVPDIHIENVHTTAKTLPDFTSRWGALVGQ